jgi:Amt family ammonium transporter
MNAFDGGAVPCLDFAGGTVVHISSGVSALICALYLGKRQGYPGESMKPHNLPLAFIGACLLWVGWFGFNAGSALAANGLAAAAFVNTHFAAAAAVLGWLLAEWLRNGKPSILGGITGAVAGLVAITPASGFVTPMAALVIGLAAGLVCYWSVAILKAKLGYDDSLDAFGVHGVGGTLGAILTGVFANSSVQEVGDGAVGLLEGNAGQAVNNLLGVVITWVLAAVATIIILKIADSIVGLRASATHEIEGLDLTQHGEEAYEL